MVNSNTKCVECGSVDAKKYPCSSVLCYVCWRHVLTSWTSNEYCEKCSIVDCDFIGQPYGLNYQDLKTQHDELEW